MCIPYTLPQNNKIASCPEKVFVFGEHMSYYPLLKVQLEEEKDLIFFYQRQKVWTSSNLQNSWMATSVAAKSLRWTFALLSEWRIRSFHDCVFMELLLTSTALLPHCSRVTTQVEFFSYSLDNMILCVFCWCWFSSAVKHYHSLLHSVESYLFNF